MLGTLRKQCNLVVMKKKVYGHLFCSLLLLASTLPACKKQTETLSLPTLAGYYPLQPGKILIYRLDSTHLDATAMQLQVSSYLVKDSTGAYFNDNTGRPTCPVYRFITDTMMNTPWQAMYTYYVTETSQLAEVVDDNNMRFIKLKQPVSESYSWPGNSYINTTNPDYQYLANWNYIYQNVNQPYTVLKGNMDSTVTVFQIDDTSPPGDFDPTRYQQRTYSLEVYAKGTGLVYKDFLHWTWQTDPPPAQYDHASYGVRLNLLDVK